MGSIPNWVTTSAKKTLRSRVQLPERPSLETFGHVLGNGFCRAVVAGSTFSGPWSLDYNPFSDQGSNVATNHSAT